MNENKNKEYKEQIKAFIRKSPVRNFLLLVSVALWFIPLFLVCTLIVGVTTLVTKPVGIIKRYIGYGTK